VRSGQRVRVGDPIGRVGNTGNARSTPPHLHFGIYRRGEGAVDPFPFVAPSRATPAPLAADTGALGSWARVARRVTEVRAAPADGAPALRTLTRWTPVRVVGASGRWFRVDLPDGAEGYVLAAATEPAAPAGASRPRRPTALLDAPTPAAAVMDSVSAGTTLRVLGRFAEFLYVRAPSGRAGWVMVEGPGTRDRGQE
jgi:hypothetical protein